MTADDVRGWIEWLRDHPFPKKYEPIPTMTPSGLWEDEAEHHGIFGDRGKVLSFFLEQLKPDPTSFPARFVAIHYYWSAWEAVRSYDPEEYTLTPSQLDRLSREALEDLTIVIRTLRVEDVPKDWGYLVWEVSSASLIGDRDRALSLYNHGESCGLKPRSEIQVIRGHFRMLMVLAKEFRQFLSNMFGDPATQFNARFGLVDTATDSERKQSC